MSETWTFPEPEPSKEWDEAQRLINETTQKWMRDRVEAFERYCVTRIVQIVREEIAKGEPAPPVAERGALDDLRERCAKACEDQARDLGMALNPDAEYAANECAKTIRALPLTPDAPSKP